MAAENFQPFDWFGPRVPKSPVIISVPHAGRNYTDRLASFTHFSAAQLLPLEDRYVDLLTNGLVEQGHRVVVARTPRAWIDLNRDESDVDPTMLCPQLQFSRPLSARVRGGLGLIPRRVTSLGELWHAPLSLEELLHRIETVHRPYHAKIRATLDTIKSHFGCAMLIDLHSMPPLPAYGRQSAVDVVIGDRFGRSCGNRFSARAANLFAAHGLKVSINVPYAGGYTLDHHGQPGRGVHAVQIELSRALYLDQDLSAPGPGLDHMRQIISELVLELAVEAVGDAWSIAAE